MLTRQESNMSAVVEDMAYYKNIVQKLKVADLQNILAYVGKRSNGRKTELQARVLNMIRSRNSGGMLKIKEIYAQLMANQQKSNQAVTTPTPAPTPTADLPSFNVNNYFLPPMSSGSLFNLPVMHPGSTIDSNHMAGAVHPDVKFRKLPFYDLIDVLLRPASLGVSNAPQLQYSRSNVLRQQQYQFYLSPQHLKHLQNKPQQAQIQVRLCKIEPTEQDDAFPNGLALRVNNKYVTLPNFIPSNKQNVPPKRPAEPLNITSKCLMSVSSPTKVFVTWDEEYNSSRFALGIFLVDKLDSGDLIHRLKSKAARPAEFTMGYIKEKYNSENDSEIKTLELTSSLICPLGKMRMTCPTKASTCAHLQCFDGATFIKMNELKPKWNCPVCDKPAYYDTLSIDGYFYDIIRACPKSNEIQLRPDGTWSLSSDQEKEGSRSNIEAHRFSPINMSTKDPSPSITTNSNHDPDCITLDSGSESNDSEDPAIVSDGEKSSSALLSSKPPKKRFRPDTENGVDASAMCVDLTEDSGDERGGRRSRDSTELNGGVTSGGGNEPGDRMVYPGYWMGGMGFYGNSEAQVSSSADSGPDSGAPPTSKTPPSGDDYSARPKIAAGPPPIEYDTLDHVSGEFSNFTRSYSQSYHSKGSTQSAGTEDTSSSSLPPPTLPLPSSTGSPQVSSSNDVITLDDDSLSPPPTLPQQIPLLAAPQTTQTTQGSTDLPPILEDEKQQQQQVTVPTDPLATTASNSSSSSPTRPPPSRSTARRLASSSESSHSETERDEDKSSPSTRPRRPLRLSIRAPGRTPGGRPRGRPPGRPRSKRRRISYSSSESSSAGSSADEESSGSSSDTQQSSDESESSEEEFRASEEDEDED